MKFTICLFLLWFNISTLCYAQQNNCEAEGQTLVQTYNKISPFYYNNQDSLYHYSNQFSNKMIAYVKENPFTLYCQFEALIKNKICSIVTSPDNNFRIYSWDTWLGGTMRKYQNIYQFTSNNITKAITAPDEEGDAGTYFTDLFLLKANGKTYYLGISTGTQSSKYAYEMITIYTTTNGNLNDSANLIKTPTGFQNYILLEYDYFTVAEKTERPIRLIKYDSNSKTIYIPVVLENGKVTKSFSRYQYNGRYFKKLK